MITEKPIRKNFIDLTGQVFGRLTVLGFYGAAGPTKRGLWRVQCSCGSHVKVVEGKALRGGHTVSCGCVRDEMARKISPELTIDGVTRTMADWARAAGIRTCTIRYRLRAGICPKDAVFMKDQRGVALASSK